MDSQFQLCTSTFVGHVLLFGCFNWMYFYFLFTSPFTRNSVPELTLLHKPSRRLARTQRAKNYTSEYLRSIPHSVAPPIIRRVGRRKNDFASRRVVMRNAERVGAC